MQVSQRITRKSASNLALSFILLPKAKRLGMAALYAFCRQVDDVADEETRPVEERRSTLALWREDIKRACLDQAPSLPVNCELWPVIRQYHLPFGLFDELIRGVEMDLEIKRYEDYAALLHYCYRVASVVGLLSIEIFGYRNPACREYAIHLGKALQLTNILRDVWIDAQKGRIYLPQSELRRFEVSPEEILEGRYSERYGRLARSVAGQARQHYQSARDILPAIDRPSMATAELMGSVYWRLLERLEAKQFAVFDSPAIRLGSASKLLLVLRAWMGLTFGMHTSSYGASLP